MNEARITVMSLSEQLREVHRILRQVTDLRSRLARGPKQIAAAENVVKKMEEELVQAKDKYRQARIQCDDKQLQLKQREAKLADYQVKLHQAESNQVYQVLKDQIAADKQANSVLSDEILEGLEKIDQLQVAVGVATENLAKSKVESEAARKRISAQMAELETELGRVLNELQDAESKLPPDFLVDYQRIVKNRGEETLAQVDRDSCGGCFQVLPPQAVNESMKGKPVVCKSCGRYLYFPDD